jgi:prepilin-type processing-associated H-X9-DG protein
LLVGEKHIPLNKLGVGWWDNSLYNGEYPSSHSRGAGPQYPLASSLTSTDVVFGGYHPGICQFGFCDGSVRRIEVGIDPTVLGNLASRNDGQVIGDY